MKVSGNKKSGCGIDFNDIITIEKRTKFIIFNNLYKSTFIVNQID